MEKLIFDDCEVVKVALQQEISRSPGSRDMTIDFMDCCFFAMG